MSLTRVVNGVRVVDETLPNTTIMSDGYFHPQSLPVNNTYLYRISDVLFSLLGECGFSELSWETQFEGGGVSATHSKDKNFKVIVGVSHRNNCALVFVAIGKTQPLDLKAKIPLTTVNACCEQVIQTIRNAWLQEAKK
jgi:hypothetical protein